MTPPAKNEVDQLQPATSIDDIQTTSKKIIKTKEEVIAVDDRVIISTPSLKGSINLKGAILDDLILLNYKESMIFGLLGVLKIRNEINCYKSVTGAIKNSVVGVINYDL